MDSDNDDKPAGKLDCKDAHIYKKVQFLPIQIGPVSTLEEMDVRVLQYQNKKLAERIEDRRKTESDLKQRIEQLEKRQTQDDVVLSVVNRYWNQLNEDIRILLLRFSAETTNETENANECDTTKSFLAQLSSSDKEELDKKLASRIQVSLRAVAKIVQAFDHMLQRFNNLAATIENNSNLESTVKIGFVEIQLQNQKLHELTTRLHETNHALSLKTKQMEEWLNARETETAELKNRLDNIEYERVELQQKHNKLEHYLAEVIERLHDYERMCSSGSGSGSGAGSNGKNETKSTVDSSNVNHKKIEKLQEELEDQRELADSRLQELEVTSQRLQTTSNEVEQLQSELRNLPKNVITETTEYKALQSQFSVLHNETVQMRTQLEEAHSQLQNIKLNHLKQLKSMEADEQTGLKKLRTDLARAEDRTAQMYREYEMLKGAYEQTIVTNEQSGMLNREMRQLINSMQSHNKRLKNETDRYKRKYKESTLEYVKLKKEVDELRWKTQSCNSNSSICSSSSSSSSSISSSGSGSSSSGHIEHYGTQRISPTLPSSSASSVTSFDSTASATKHEHSHPPILIPETIFDLSADDYSISGEISPTRLPSLNPDKQRKRMRASSGSIVRKDDASFSGMYKDAIMLIDCCSSPSSEIEIKDLKISLRKAVNDTKELKLLLDMYKSAGKEHRDKTALMMSERKLKAELEDAKMQLRQLQRNRCDDRRKVSDDESSRRIKYLEEEVGNLQKINESHKQEETASLCEMEVTGQAFEDMQEQNSRLLQQLREKDDANFKLMTERIKSEQMYKTAKNEKDVLQSAVTNLNVQLNDINSDVLKMEEKERLLQQQVENSEKELITVRQSLIQYKRKAIESAQSATALKTHLEKYHVQMKEAQQIVLEKTGALESETYKTNRMQEEIGQMKRKIERMKKIEAAGTMDTVLMEEIREYKETLTCTSCKVKRIDAILMKCFHVFCFDCLRTRYEMRQRKCPKCNAAFGANDYHRLYLNN